MKAMDMNETGVNCIVLVMMQIKENHQHFQMEWGGMKMEH